VQILLNRDANIEAKDINGNTALGWALGSKRYAVLKLLVIKNANVDVQDKDGRTPMSYAVQNRDEHAVRTLLPHSVDTVIGDDFRRTLEAVQESSRVASRLPE
jgi:ankyrin repeat protein